MSALRETAELFPPRSPRVGEMVEVRSRRWLVEAVEDSDPEASPRVSLAHADDDAQGQTLEVYWDFEIDRRILEQEAWSAIGTRGFDPPRYFSAFLHTLRWNCVTATDPNLFQSPFRAGIKIDAYQMEPLRKALRMPRVNLFIADDTGLGKTIEAGLIARELLLRKKARTIVVAAPASVLEQWKAEMEERFGLLFVILDRAYLARIRQERGFGINPWRTHSRFLVSHNLLIDPAYADPMREWLGERLPGSLLILDEAHHAAPSSGGRYGIETKFTRAIRDLGGRFEHRLFLSATPHNGHSNSFSTLLELLAPYRFTRGVPVRGKSALEAVMVRRIKEDIREVQGGFPERKVEPIRIDGLPEDAPELALHRLAGTTGGCSSSRRTWSARSATSARCSNRPSPAPTSPKNALRPSTDRPSERRRKEIQPPLQHRSGPRPLAHSHRHRRRPRRSQLPGALHGPLPLRPPLEPRPHRAAERAHRPQAATGADGALPLLRASAAHRGPRPRRAGEEDRDHPVRARQPLQGDRRTTSNAVFVAGDPPRRRGPPRTGDRDGGLDRERKRVAAEELEAARERQEDLKRRSNGAAGCSTGHGAGCSSRRSRFRDAMSCSLEMLGSAPLEAGRTEDGEAVWTFPPLDGKARADASWTATLDTLAGAPKDRPEARGPGGAKHRFARSHSRTPGCSPTTPCTCISSSAWRSGCWRGSGPKDSSTTTSPARVWCRPPTPIPRVILLGRLCLFGRRPSGCTRCSCRSPPAGSNRRAATVRSRHTRRKRKRERSNAWSPRFRMLAPPARRPTAACTRPLAGTSKTCCRN